MTADVKWALHDQRDDAVSHRFSIQRVNERGVVDIVCLFDVPPTRNGNDKEAAREVFEAFERGQRDAASPGPPDVVGVLEGLIEGVEAEVNEKGGGGFVLARLSDIRTLLAQLRGEG